MIQVLKYLRTELLFSLIAFLFLMLTNHYVLASLSVIYTLYMLYLDNREFKEESQFDNVVRQFSYRTNHIVVDTSADIITICGRDSCIAGRFNAGKLDSLEHINSCGALEKLKSLLISPKKESFKAYGHNYLAFDKYDVYFTNYYITDGKLLKKLKLMRDAVLANANGVELLGCNVYTVYNTYLTNLKGSIFFFYLLVTLCYLLHITFK